MPVTVHFTFKQDCWIFLIIFAFTLVFFLELETRKGCSERSVQRVYLYIWATAGDELTAIGTHAQSFNLWLISYILNYFLSWNVIFFHRWLDEYNRNKLHKTWTFKFDKFSEFQNVTSDGPSFTWESRCDTLCTKIDMWLTRGATHKWKTLF